MSEADLPPRDEDLYTVVKTHCRVYQTRLPALDAKAGLERCEKCRELSRSTSKMPRHRAAGENETAHFRKQQDAQAEAVVRRVDDFTPEAAEDILELFLRFPFVTLGRLADDFKVPPSTMVAVLNRARQRRRWQVDASMNIAKRIEQRKLLRRSS